MLLKQKSVSKWISFGIIGALLFLGLATYFFRLNLFKELIGPSIPYQVDTHPNAPNYEDSSAWAKRPQTIKHGQIAVFYVHPTTYYSGKIGWNADINDAESRRILEEIAIPNHATPFDFNNNLWIPRYRQATLFASLAFNDDTKEAMNLAYSDIDAAFENFNKALGSETPFILVGMNQGGLHILRLIQTKIANTKLQDRLVGAYLVDQTIEQKAFNTKNFGTINLCKSPNDTKCIISFLDIDENAKRMKEIFKKRSPVWSPQEGYHALANEDNICVNPLNGGQKDDADETQNQGAATATKLESGTLPALLPNETGAKCNDGMLLVSSARSQNLKPPYLELGTFYKVPIFNLFYQNLHIDAENRARRFEQTQK